jgi:DNA-binding beta-propeller fold protein YncE
MRSQGGVWEHLLYKSILQVIAGMNQKNLFCATVIAACVGILVQPLAAETVAIDQIGGFKSPTRIVVSNSGSIYVADHKKGSVVTFDGAGNKIGVLSGFSAPLGLAVLEIPASIECTKYSGKKGKCKEWTTIPGKTYLFVGDKGDGSVQVFINGEKDGALGAGSGEFIMPNAIAVTKDLTVYVVDSKANEVKVYDSSGSLQTVFGGSGFDFPSDIALNETAGELYVSDFFNKRIRVFGLGGGWLRDIEAPPNDQGDPVFYRPIGLGIDPEGNLYVVDNALACVAKISSQGVLLDTIGYRDGEYWTGELAAPVDAAAYGTKIYVTSNGQRQLRVFEVVP